MPTFIIISDCNRSAGGTCDFRVHRDGCRDIARHQALPRYRHAGNSWPRNAESGADAVRLEVEEFQSQEMEIDSTHFHICNCCKK